MRLRRRAAFLARPKVVATGFNFLARSGSTLTHNGKTWRGAVANWHWAALRETNLQYPTHAMIDEVLDECVSLGVSVIRAHTLGMSAGLPNSLVTSINADASLVWNNAAWEPIDYVVAGCKARGIRLWIPFTDQFNYYHKGKGWWVQQAFIRQATSGIPSSYTYSGAPNGGTETGVTSFDPASGTSSNSTRVKKITQQFYSLPWLDTAWNVNYVGPWWEHTNQYTNVVNKNEPVLSFAAAGNEMWDSGDQYADHAGADGIAWAKRFSATVKSKNPKIMVIDPLGADGVNIDFAPGRNDVNTDILDVTHLYNNGQTITSGQVNALAAKAAAFNKVAAIGEYPFTNAGINTALSEIESNSVMAMAGFWAIYSSSEGHTSGGVDDSVYTIGGNSGWKTTFQRHAAVMNGGTVPPAPVLTNIMRSATVANSEAAVSSYASGSTDTNDPVLSIEANTGVSGSAVKAVCSGSGHKWVYVTDLTSAAPVTPGSTYTATAHVKLVSGTLSSGYYGHLTWFTSAGSYISGATSSGTVSTSGNYSQVTFSGVAPANAAFAVPQIEYDGPASGSSTVLIDQWGIFAGTNASPWVAPS